MKILCGFIFVSQSPLFQDQNYYLQTKIMLDIPAQVFDEQDGLVSVSYALFDRDPKFITAIEFEFSSFNLTFRANPDDDTLSVELGSLEFDLDESRIEVSDSEPWSLCKGSSIQCFWRLTNHQGYDDGLRMEFAKCGEKFRLVIEFIVTASAIQIFTATENGTIKI